MAAPWSTTRPRIPNSASDTSPLRSPEPKNDGSLKADFPAGVYKFTGTATTGATLQGEATLSHKFPDTAHVVRPRPEEKNVPITGMQVRWNAVKDAAAFIVVIEHEKTGREVRANLPGSATSFTVSDGFLAPGLEYKLAIGTVAKDGNRSFTETAFTTAARKVVMTEGTDHDPNVPA